MDLENKHIIVTGGAKGIGKTLVKQLIKQGAVVGILDNDSKAIDSCRKEYPSLFSEVCDITIPAEIIRSIDKFVEKYKVIDVLVNNAGIIHNEPIVGFSDKGFVAHDITMWNKTININLNSAFYVSSIVVHKMISKRTRGVIVNVSSICAEGNIGQGAYSAAKAGLEALVVTWAKELGPFRIRVVGVAPGFTDTDAVRHSMETKTLDAWRKLVPLNRLAKPEEIADSILFAIKNDYFNGQILRIDGGLRL